jgi:hypothetical protein
MITQTKPTPQRTYPTANEVFKTLVLFRLGRLLDRAKNDLDHTLRGSLATYESAFLMETEELRACEALVLRDKRHHNRTDDEVANDLQKLIRDILETSGDAKFLAHHGIEVQVWSGERLGYGYGLWAKFFPIPE